MASRFLPVLLMTFTVPTSAQVGTVRYEHDYPLVLSRMFAFQAYAAEQAGRDAEEPADRATVLRTLVFDSTASLMFPTDKPHIEPDDRLIADGEEEIDTTHVSFADGSYTESRVLWGDIYLITDHRRAIPWRLVGGERQLLGHQVFKAEAVADSGRVEAWYTPAIPLPAGPGHYGGLPGLILMVTNSGSGESYVVQSLEQGLMDRAIEPPVRGRPLSDEAYRKRKAAEIEEDRRFWDMHRRTLKVN
ncbi:MAG: GLPGLI family protein [Bacteroidota bacterium]|nr:GLPGLI family protein [Bacteroidota bacterium]